MRDSRRRGLVASLTSTIAANLPVFFTGSLAVQLQRDLGRLVQRVAPIPMEMHSHLTG